MEGAECSIGATTAIGYVGPSLGRPGAEPEGERGAEPEGERGSGAELQGERGSGAELQG